MWQFGTGVFTVDDILDGLLGIDIGLRKKYFILMKQFFNQYSLVM